MQTATKTAHAINPELGEFYQYLEDLRASGVCNMLGAAQYLQDDYDLERGDAREVVLQWIENYNELLATGVIKVTETTTEEG